MMFGVMFGEKHSYDDFGLILSSKIVSPPVAQINLVEVPLRDGSIDITETLTDDVKYKDRTITLNFSVIDARNTWSAKVSAISNYLHGKRLKIVFDDDAAFYYVGRVEVDEWTSEKNVGLLVIRCTVEPYKYDMLSSAVDWEWDIFDFENGIINETGKLTVNGTRTVSLIGRRKRVFPIITASTSMTLSFKGSSYDLKAGSQTVYDIFLSEGENELTFTGNGTVSIDYKGGSL